MAQEHGASAVAHGHKPGVQIFINDKPFKTPKDEMTGAEIKQLGGIATGRQLFVEVPPGHGPNRQIRDDETVEVKNGMKFHEGLDGTLG
jgi:hypothetical protein